MKLNRKKMIVYINGRFLTQSVTGVQRYAIEVVKIIDCLVKKSEEFKKYKIIILSPFNSQYNIDLNHITQKNVGILKGHLWEQIELPFYARDGFLINLCNVAPIFKKNQILTIHDAAVYAFPDGFSFLFRTWYKFVFKILSKRLNVIITVSDFSKKELSEYCKIKHEKFKVIHLGIEHVLNIENKGNVLEKYGLADKKFMFAVSSMNPNKNFKAVIETAKLRPEYLFVIAGGTNPKIFSHNKMELPLNVKYIGYITDEELIDLYRHARCFIYPSLYEGFGFPPLEAMAYGCPVIVSRSASLPEICGDAAIYCDPYSAEDIAKKIRLILNDEKISVEFSQRGLEHVKRFSWEKCTKELMQFIKISNDE